MSQNCKGKDGSCRAGVWRDGWCYQHHPSTHTTAPDAGCPRCEDPEAPTLHRHPVGTKCVHNWYIPGMSDRIRDEKCGWCDVWREYITGKHFRLDESGKKVYDQPATDAAPLGEVDYNAIIYDVQQELTTLRTCLAKAEHDRDHFRHKRAELRKHVRSMQRATAMWKSIASKAIDQATVLRAQQAGKELKP